MSKPNGHIVTPVLFIVVVVAVVVLTNSSTRAREEVTAQQATGYAVPAVWHLFARLCDTVYVTGDRYLDVSLVEQRVTLRYRNGDTLAYPISSGNRFISDGMATPTGIYSVQGKSPMAVSRQFDDAKLHSWIGFNGNIGFHGLDGNGYYRTLGVRPSSHGCLRMARDDIKNLYTQVRTGTPVIVHGDYPARVLAFADTASFSQARGIRLGSRTKEYTNLLKKRLDLLYSGKLYASALPPVFMDDTTRLRPGGYEIGRFDLVTLYHERPVVLPENIFLLPMNDRIVAGGGPIERVPPTEVTGKEQKKQTREAKAQQRKSNDL